MHVIFLNHWYDAGLASPEDLLQAYHTLTGWADALQDAGADVTVVQRFHREVRFRRNGVDFVLFSDGHPPKLRPWHVPRSFNRAVRAICKQHQGPQVVHFNGLIFPSQLRTLRAALPCSVPIVAQHHGEMPWQGIRSSVQKWGLRAADGFFFAASELASTWIARGFIRRSQAVFEVMEGSTLFRRQDRAAARRQTGMSGDPVVLWVGRLIPLKDPLTVLEGFATVVQSAPGARLYMVYGDDLLLPEVRKRIERDPSLSKCVNLVGAVTHQALELMYNSADIFVLGSHREGSGYSLAEAMACGVVPVVTDIPSFRVMTGCGRIGACWTPGDSAAFASAFLQVCRQPLGLLSEKTSRFFQEHLSFPAIARTALRAYEELAAGRLRRK